MKSLVATLLLLFQLQPLLGSAACLISSERPSKLECEMPEQHATPAGSVLQSGSPSQGCALAFACATSALTVPTFSEGQESSIPLDSVLPSSIALTLTSVVSAPPFHPPRA
jgi:hypothetical protein